ncbi:hypothetical protein Tco_1215514 [Tanacetum coccineum]
MVDHLGSFQVMNIEKTSDLPRVCSQFGSISQAFETQEKNVGDVMRRLSFDITKINAHLEVGNSDAVNFDGSCHEGLSHDESFIQDKVDEELDNVNGVVPLRGYEQCHDVNHDRVNKDTHNGMERNTSRVDEQLDNDNAPLETATWIGEDIHNDYDPQDCEYDANSSENDRCRGDDDDVIIDEDHEIDEAEIEKMDIDDFGTESDGEGDGLCRRRSSLNKLKKAFMQGQLDGNKYALYCGQVFGSSKEVKDKVYFHSIETRRDLKLVRNDKLRVRAMCFGKILMYTTTSHQCFERLKAY